LQGNYEKKAGLSTGLFLLYVSFSAVVLTTARGVLAALLILASLLAGTTLLSLLVGLLIILLLRTGALL
jgi:hypothetical protein